ncbi:CRISPR-associated protein Cas4 [Actinokineospora bangkokensis]|uniref:CRISPR-associated protein Cas4 n=1 Tax=Actinokineospora bangkokensis TaxID=1193682 RepID=UPI001E3CC3EE|nr:CRISPR-associated protein Cas4 [Actinokineospora bangkokensis]
MQEDSTPSIPLSALEHHAYCPRQAVLIHLDGYFDANVDTIRGDLAHAAVDSGGPGKDRDGTRVWRSLPVVSHTLRVHGVCDVVRFESTGHVPVEHKSGAYRPGGPADVQVAAQALCLKEMFGTPVPTGVIFAGADRRRHVVDIDAPLRARVVETTRALRALLAGVFLPAPVNDRRCRRCSLREGCMPDVPVDPGTLFTARPEASWDD